MQGDSQLLKFSALSYPHSKVILGYFPISWDTRLLSQYQHIRFAILPEVFQTAFTLYYLK